MCMNGYWQAWEMLMTSNEVHAVSGSLFSTPSVFCVCVKTLEDKEKKEKLPFRSHVLISLATHTEAIKEQTVSIHS